MNKWLLATFYCFWFSVVLCNVPELLRTRLRQTLNRVVSRSRMRFG